MTLTELLAGKKMNYMTDAKIPVELEIKTAEEKHNSRDVGPSNASNDWWPAQETWYTYDITFTNGFKKSYGSLYSLLKDIISEK